VTAIYASSLVLGIVGLLVWVVRMVVVDTVGRATPNALAGEVGGAVTGFGMAGMAASFGGLGVVVSFGAALAGAGILFVLARMFGAPST